MWDQYHILKTLHLIAAFSWMAGMLYLPRLYVYHASANVGSELSETLKIMERKLLRYIINPAMIATWVFGIWLAVSLNAFDGKANGYWLHGKLGLVILMQICHAFLARYRRQFAQDRNTHSPHFYRMLNEVPTVLMVGIIAIVVIKPF